MCVSMRAHARVCMRMCFVLQVLGQVLHGAGAHVCRAPGAGAAAGAGAGAGAGAAGAGAGAGAWAGSGAGSGSGAGAGPSPLFTHPHCSPTHTVHPPTKLIFANLGNPGASK